MFPYLPRVEGLYARIAPPSGMTRAERRASLAASRAIACSQHGISSGWIR